MGGECELMSVRVCDDNFFLSVTVFFQSPPILVLFIMSVNLSLPASHT